jgi:Lon protease-like protein
MSETPDTFDTIPTLVPLFPLPDHVLLPASPTPYRVFEPRYRQMVADLLERPADERWLVMPRLMTLEDTEDAETSDSDGDSGLTFYPVTSLAKMTLATPLPDGDFLIVVEGVAPCMVREVDAPFTGYRVGSVVALADRPRSAGTPETSTNAVIQALMSLLLVMGPSAADIPVAYGGSPSDTLIIYRIAAAVVADADARQRILDERCPATRRAMVLEALIELLEVASRHGDVQALGTPQQER